MDQHVTQMILFRVIFIAKIQSMEGDYIEIDEMGGLFNYNEK